TTGIFSNLSELFSSGGVGTPLAPMVAHPGNGSSGGSGNGSTGVISVPPPFGIGFGYYGGMMTFCTPPYASNNTTGMGSAGTIPYDPWQNTSCSTSTSGTESAMGNEYNYPYFANASGAGMNHTGGPAVVGFTGPYVPGPALGEIVSGSDLFGGAAGSWPPLEVLEGYFGYGIGPGGPGYLGSGGSGGYSGMPPTPPPPPAAFPTIRTTPLAPANSPSSSSPMISAGTLVLVAAVVIAGLAGCLGTAFLMRRRPGVPPPPTGPR
ncbi:MAG: hypothetical protein L3K08_04350, partial [Thermoplasmata archaeon]|nr:hypothetical protein [Thermoplasmata archaeon]